ncbi:NADPH-dependent pterin aldehyde reductase [Tanacetum coccineum]
MATTVGKAVMNGGGGGGQKKTVLITGVSRGLGKALAIEMAKRGHFVIGASRSQPSLQSQLPDHLFFTADVVSSSIPTTLKWPRQPPEKVGLYMV